MFYYRFDNTSSNENFINEEEKLRTMSAIDAEYKGKKNREEMFVMISKVYCDAMIMDDNDVASDAFDDEAQRRKLSFAQHCSLVCLKGRDYVKLIMSRCELR